MKFKQILIFVIIGVIICWGGYKIYKIQKRYDSELLKEINTLKTENDELETKYLEKSTAYDCLKTSTDNYKATTEATLLLTSITELSYIEPLQKYDKQAYLTAYKNIMSYAPDPSESIYDVTTDDEFDLICGVVQAEIGVGNFDQKVNVATTIINRYDSEQFPSTWEEVIKQKGQYQTISNGAYKKYSISQDTIDAIEYAYYFGSDDIKDATYFCADNSDSNSWHENNLIKIYDDGKHTFYKAKGDE